MPKVILEVNGPHVSQMVRPWLTRCERLEHAAERDWDQDRHPETLDT